MGELDALLDLAPVGNRYLFQQPESPGDSNSFWSTPDGALGVAEIRNALGLLDVAYIVNYGAATTFVTAKTGLTAAQPDLNLDIPAGTSVILLGFQVAFGAMTGTVNHFWLQFGSSLVGNGTSNAATGGPTSLGTPILSACTARQAYSGSGTAPASPLELFSLEDPTAATGSVGVTSTAMSRSSAVIPPSNDSTLSASPRSPFTSVASSKMPGAEITSTRNNWTALRRSTAAP